MLKTLPVVLAAAIALYSTTTLTAVTAVSVGFVHDDLLAHPKYFVHHLKDYVNSSSINAEQFRHGNPHDKALIDSTASQRVSDDEVRAVGMEMYKTKAGNSYESSDSTNGEDLPGKQMIMKNASGQKWMCNVPAKPKRKPVDQPMLTPEEAEAERQRAIRVGLELLEPLTGTCFTAKQDHWTWEYCHKDRARQYHAILSNGKWVPDNPEFTYIVGRYFDPSKPVEVQGRMIPGADGKLRFQRSSNAPVEHTTTGYEISNDRKYLSQKWVEGTICFDTSMPRTILIQYQCASDIPTEVIVEALETSTCNYMLVIDTPRLCADPAFQNTVDREVTDIQCRPIVDEDFVLEPVPLEAKSIDSSAAVDSQQQPGTLNKNVATDSSKEDTRADWEEIRGAIAKATSGLAVGQDKRDALLKAVQELERSASAKKLEARRIAFDAEGGMRINNLNDHLEAIQRKQQEQAAGADPGNNQQGVTSDDDYLQSLLDVLQASETWADRESDRVNHQDDLGSQTRTAQDNQKALEDELQQEIDKLFEQLVAMVQEHLGIDVTVNLGEGDAESKKPEKEKQQSKKDGTAHDEL